MTYEVRVRARARRDIQDAASWYASQQPELGGEFLDEVRDSFGRISENPKSFPEMHRQTRRALVARFPFCVFYRITGNVITVVAVMHSSRDPNNWKSRI
ncbi:MAG: type II toxin-antitoxin system RelE/ParE family toxin [Nitrospiraceae bacterium]